MLPQLCQLMRFILFFLAIFVAGCGEQAPPPIDRAKELVILTRVGASTYSVDAGNGASGFDYDLACRLADELGLKSHFIVAASDDDIRHRLKNGEAQLAAAWQTPDAELRASTPYFKSHNVLVTHEASLPLASINQLANKVVHVVAGSRQEQALREIQRKVPRLSIAANDQHSELDLLEGVASHRYEAALVNNAEFDIGSNYYPELQDSLMIGQSRPIVWLFAPDVEPELIAKANDFLERFQQSGEMDRLKDRYFGHVERLTPADSVRFIARMRSVLPQYRALFYAAQVKYRDRLAAARRAGLSGIAVGAARDQPDRRARHDDADRRDRRHAGHQQPTRRGAERRRRRAIRQRTARRAADRASANPTGSGWRSPPTTSAWDTSTRRAIWRRRSRPTPTRGTR